MYLVSDLGSLLMFRSFLPYWKAHHEPATKLKVTHTQATFLLLLDHFASKKCFSMVHGKFLLHCYRRCTTLCRVPRSSLLDNLLDICSTGDKGADVTTKVCRHCYSVMCLNNCLLFLLLSSAVFRKTLQPHQSNFCVNDL